MADNDWIVSYMDLMAADKLEESLTLKDLNFPESFFRYRKLNENTLKSIINDEIWLSTLTSLNDPFECSLQVDNNECLRVYFSSEPFKQGFKRLFGLELSSEELEHIVKSDTPYIEYSQICFAKNIELNITPQEQLNRVQKRWSEIMDDASRSIRVSCFSKFNNSLLMWSHYADEHKGICIEYDFIDHGEIRAFIQPIIYSNEVYKLGTFEDLHTLNLIRATLTKCKDWEYESEWRLTIVQAKGRIRQTINAPKPKAIYLGTRFTQSEASLIKEFQNIVKERNIPVYKMIKHPTEYKLIRSD